MKTKTAVWLTAALAVVVVGTGSAGAATVYWDSASSAGDWNTTNTNWGTASGGPYNTAYGASAEDAVFEGTGGTVTVNATNPAATSMSFVVDGYTVTKSATSDVITMNGGSVNVGAGLTATIDAKINGSVTSGAGFTKTGDGTLILGTGMVGTYANSWNTGTVKSTVVDGGTLKLATAFGLPGAVGASAAQRGSLLIKSGTFDVNGTSNAIATTITLGGASGTTAKLLDTNPVAAFLPVAAIPVIYDATENPNMATVDATLGSGTSSSAVKTLQIGNSSATDADLEFSGTYTHQGSNTSRQLSLTKAGAGTLLFSGQSGAGGTTAINEGTYIAASTSALGIGWDGTVGTAVISDGATLGFQGGIDYTTAKPLTISGAGDAGNSRIGAIQNFAGNNSFAGDITMAADSSIGASAGQLTLSGAIGGAFALTKTGPGAVVLAGASAYTGSTTVSDGALLINGSIISNTTVNGGVLGGSGDITGNVAVNALGTIAPGNSIGTLSVNGTLDLAGIADMEISKTAGPGYSADLIDGISTLTYGGQLKVTLELGSDPLAAGDVWNLFDAAAFSGTFSSYDLPVLSGGLLWDTSKLSVDGTIGISVVPEPSAFGLLLFGCAVFLAIGKKRRS